MTYEEINTNKILEVLEKISNSDSSCFSFLKEERISEQEPTTNNLAFNFTIEETKYKFVFTENNIMMFDYLKNNTLSTNYYDINIISFIASSITTSENSNIFIKNENGLSIANTILRNIDYSKYPNNSLCNIFQGYISYEKNPTKIFIRALCEAGKDVESFKYFFSNYIQLFDKETLDSAFFGRNEIIIQKLYEIFYGKADFNTLKKACYDNNISAVKYFFKKYFFTDYIKEYSEIKISELFGFITNPDIALFIMNSIYEKNLGIYTSYNYLIRKSLDNAVINNNLDIIYVLLKDIDSKHIILKLDYGKILVRAFEAEYIEIIRLLIENYNIDINMEIHRKVPLYYAIEKGNIDIINLLLKHKDININESVLKLAIEKGNSNIFELLLSYQNIDTNYGLLNTNLLLYAIEKESIDIIGFLLSHKDTILNTDIEYTTPLCYAIEKGNIDIIKLLLSCSNLDVNYINKFYKETPLCYAIKNKNINKDIIEMLLSHKNINVNYTEVFKHATPLYYAIKRGEKDIVDWLLSKHGNIKIEESNLIYAIEKGDINIFNLLLEHKKNIDINFRKSNEKTPLCYAIEKENIDIIKSLLSCNDIDVNYTAKYCKTPLCYAIEKENMDIINLLLSQPKIDVNLEYSIDKYLCICPLNQAISKKNMDIVKLLLKQKNIKVDIMIYDEGCNRCDTLLNYFIRKGEKEIIKLLLSCNDINVNCTDYYFYEAPLHCAVKKGDMDIINLLLSHPQININIKNKNKENPLYYAVKYGKIEVFNLLFQKSGIKLCPINIHGVSLLPHAARFGYIEIVKILLKVKNIDINERCEGKKSIILAAENEHEEIVKLLLSQENIKLEEKDKKFLLYFAIVKGNVDLVNLVLEKCKYIHYYTFTERYENSSENLFKIFTTPIFNFTIEHNPLSLAVINNQEKIAQLLVSKSSLNINGIVTVFCYHHICNRVKCHYPILSLAIKKANINIVQTLLSHQGINVNKQDNLGKTPLHTAVECGNINIVQKLLLHQMINIDIQDSSGKTPLHTAVECKNKKIAQILIEKKLSNAKIKFIEKRKIISELNNIKQVIGNTEENEKLFKDLESMIQNYGKSNPTKSTDSELFESLKSTSSEFDEDSISLDSIEENNQKSNTPS